VSIQNNWSLPYSLLGREASYRWFGYYNGEELVRGLESVIMGADMREGDGVGANQPVRSFGGSAAAPVVEQVPEDEKS
jgi:hypothetical protein